MLTNRCVHVPPLFLLITLLTLIPPIRCIIINSSNCGKTKVCLYRPDGCVPNIDCAIAVNFQVDAKNSLRIQMAAQSLIPLVPLQYIAVGFSYDKKMGDDMVVECVVSSEVDFEPDVYASYNKIEKANDRTYLPEKERKDYFRNLTGGIVDGRLYCEFTVQLIPQISHEEDRVWNLNKDYYIFAATGTAQPDELNAHDTSSGSHFYPIISKNKENPSRTGEGQYDLSDLLPNVTAVAPDNRTKKDPSSASTRSIPFVSLCYVIFLFIIKLCC